jgi:hypothetical protein
MALAGQRRTPMNFAGPTMGLTYWLSRESKLQMKTEIQGGVNKDKTANSSRIHKVKTKKECPHLAQLRVELHLCPERHFVISGLLDLKCQESNKLLQQKI